LLDRFGALAYPSRDRGPAFQQTGRQMGNAPRRGTRDAKGRWLPPEQPLGAADTARLQLVGQFGKALAPLLNAVLAGLIAAPGEISRHAEALAHLEPGDPDMAHLLDSLLHLGDSPDHADSQAQNLAKNLETAGLGPILAKRGVRLPDAGDFGGLPYGAIAAGDADLIAEAVELLVEMPRVEAAMADATQACENELSEQSFAEQQRLVQRRLALRARLGHMGRARAAL
jgi:DNA primase